MAFNGVGNFWLDPRKSSVLFVAVGPLLGHGADWGGRDAGALWIVADGIGTAEANLAVDEQTKHKKGARGNPIAYGVTVTNRGSNPANFSLQGGGNI